MKPFSRAKLRRTGFPTCFPTAMDPSDLMDYYKINTDEVVSTVWALLERK